MSVGIYKIINPNNHLYIGQSIDIERRWKEYQRLQCKGQPILYRSLIKYGIDSHKFEIIELCDESELLTRETFWKIHFKVLEIESLCCRIDGHGGRMSLASREKMSKSKIGIKPKPESIEKQRLNSRQRREVLQLDLDGNLIKEWFSISDVNKVYGSINNCLYGKTESYKGFIWKYKNGQLPAIAQGGPEIGKSNKNKGLIRPTSSVCQLRLDGKLIKTFPSVFQAQKEIGCVGIYEAIKNPQYTIGGYRWCLESEILNLPKFTRRKIFPVEQYSIDGEYIATYNSISEIKSKFKNTATVYDCCYGNLKTALGFVWKSKYYNHGEFND